MLSSSWSSPSSAFKIGCNATRSQKKATSTNGITRAAACSCIGPPLIIIPRLGFFSLFLTHLKVMVRRPICLLIGADTFINSLASRQHCLFDFLLVAFVGSWWSWPVASNAGRRQKHVLVFSSPLRTTLHGMCVFLPPAVATPQRRWLVGLVASSCAKLDCVRQSLDTDLLPGMYR
jgi:hypothetical protein